METTVQKNQIAQVGAYSYKYVDIAKIHEYLEKNNMRYWQYTETIDGNDYIMTVPTIEGKELPPRRGCRIVNATLQGKSNPAQEQGSAITYARRYSLLMAFGLATEDDDANSLTRERKATEKQVAFLKQKYQGEAFKKLLDLNQIEVIEDISMEKASELISKIKENK